MNLWPQLELDPELSIDRVMVRSGSDHELLVGLESENEQLPEFTLDVPLSFVLLGKDQDLVLSGEPTSRFVIKDTEFITGVRSFFQTNLKQAEGMVNYVLGLVKWNDQMTVLDLYCGVGLFSRFIAPHVKELIGIELSESACNDFATNLEQFDNTSLYVGAVEEILPQLKVGPDVIIVDPPRAGLDQGVLKTLIASSAARLIYVSCDPTTLARDCKSLVEGGYKVETVQPFDLFPQTYHVETIVLLNKSL